MKRNARRFFSAVFFLCGLAAFAALPWVHRSETERLLRTEPHFRSPIPVFSGRLMIRNDAFGKGRFGASRGSKGQRSHKGIDLLTQVGSPVSASKSGRVSAAGIGKGYGWYVEMRHPDGRTSRYAHLNKVSVSTGEWVEAGRQLGEAGKSGNARDPRIRPHLHFEIRQGEEALDPARLFEPKLTVR